MCITSKCEDTGTPIYTLHYSTVIATYAITSLIIIGHMPLPSKSHKWSWPCWTQLTLMASKGIGRAISTYSIYSYLKYVIQYYIRVAYLQTKQSCFVINSVITDSESVLIIIALANCSGYLALQMHWLKVLTRSVYASSAQLSVVVAFLLMEHTHLLCPNVLMLCSSRCNSM